MKTSLRMQGELKMNHEKEMAALKEKRLVEDQIAKNLANDVGEFNPTPAGSTQGYIGNPNKDYDRPKMDESKIRISLGTSDDSHDSTLFLRSWDDCVAAESSQAVQNFVSLCSIGKQIGSIEVVVNFK